jgi:DNA-binding transcriptional MerR regulator
MLGTMTRSELQGAVGLSRKALRVYEEAGLLSPIVLPNGRAIYDDTVVSRANFIVTLRNAGISLTMIGQLLDPGSCADGFLLSKIVEQLTHNARKAEKAIELIEAHAKRMFTDVFEYRYGGSWSMGLETVVAHNKVVQFIQKTANSLKDEGHEVDSISVLYQAETDCDVKLRVFRLCEWDERASQSAWQWLYLHRHRYLAVQATGFFGDYHCFDDAYAKIADVRAKRKIKAPPQGTIEIYKKYPLRLAPGKAFKSMILA